MIPRPHARLVHEQLAVSPAVAILGPRRCGKTTLARRFDPAYFDMETEGDRARLDAEWEPLTRGDRLIVIDEVQHEPKVFARLRGSIDADRGRNGRFILLGSVAPELMERASGSLAGRLGLVHMGPLSLPELTPGQLDDLWLRGGFPDGGILKPDSFPGWQQDYLEWLVSRDLPAWGVPAKPQPMLRLAAMLAAVHGQALNATQLGASLSINYKTVQSRCDALEEAFLIRRLQPFSGSGKKRLLKAPRVYWRDSGLLHALMNVSDLDQLYRQPWLGQSWVGFVIEQTLSTLALTGKHVAPFFYRTSDGYELDLVLEYGDERWAIEVKLTSDPSTAELDRLEKTADMIAADRRVLVCRIAQPIESERLLVVDLPGWLERLRG
jgi:predicted AAA+ superfamily ATPase